MALSSWWWCCCFCSISSDTSCLSPTLRPGGTSLSAKLAAPLPSSEPPVRGACVLLVRYRVGGNVAREKERECVSRSRFVHRQVRHIVEASHAVQGSHKNSRSTRHRLVELQVQGARVQSLVDMHRPAIADAVADPHKREAVLSCFRVVRACLIDNVVCTPNCAGRCHRGGFRRSCHAHLNAASSCSIRSR